MPGINSSFALFFDEGRVNKVKVCSLVFVDCGGRGGGGYVPHHILYFCDRPSSPDKEITDDGRGKADIVAPLSWGEKRTNFKQGRLFLIASVTHRNCLPPHPTLPHPTLTSTLTPSPHSNPTLDPTFEPILFLGRGGYGEEENTLRLARNHYSPLTKKTIIFTDVHPVSWGHTCM